jgi:predicted DCC family thiol-disulfide oxidoreductase YuxK
MQELTKSNWQIEVFYDGACPLCRREINFLRRRDKHQNILATDISEETFEPSCIGIPMSDLMDHIHGRSADGTILKGVDVFRQLYSAVGFGWIIPITRLPGIRHVLDAAYDVFARNRLRLTNRGAECKRCVGEVS